MKRTFEYQILKTTPGDTLLEIAYRTKDLTDAKNSLAFMTNTNKQNSYRLTKVYR